MSEPKIRLGQISPSSSGTDQLSGNVALAGNLTFSGTGLRILGDMSNATFSNRLTFQTSTANGFTTLQFAPNGTGTGSATRLFASSDIDNSAAAAIVAGGATSSMSFQSVITGSGTYMPMTFLTGGSERMRLDTSGNLGIGGTALAFSRVQVTGTLPSGSSASVAHYVNATVPSTSTNNFQGFRTDISTEAAAFTVANGYHFYAARGTIGAGSAITNQYGFYVDGSIIGATNNYGVYSGINSGSNRWNFYAVGTAANYFAGDTGIGTTTIPARFTVQGAGTSTTVGGNIVSRFQTNGSGYDASIQLSDNVTNSAILSMLAGNISLISNGSNYFHIIASGYTGINTTSPASQLHVNSTSEWGIRLRYASDTTTNRATFLSQRARGSLASPTAVTNGTIIGGIEGGGYTGAAYTSGYDGGAAIHFISEQNWAAANTPTYIAFFTNPTGSAGPTERMRIRGSGGLAINNSLSASHALTVTRPGGGLERSFYVDNDGRTTARFDDNGMSQNLYLRNLGMTGANHGASILAYINEDGTDAFGGAIRFGAETDYSITRHSYLSFNISRSGNDTEGMRINSLGNLLLGTTSDLGEGARLNIVTASGEADVTTWRYFNAAAGKYWKWFIDSNSRLHCYNQSGAGVYINDGDTSWTGSSDERLKTDLKTIEDSVNKVCQLRAVTGRFKTDVENTSRSFLIAQDVQKVFPEAVSDQNPDELGLRYIDIIPLLVASIKELKTELDFAKNRITELENK